MENQGQFDAKWLNEMPLLDAAYIKAMGGHKVSHSDQYRYFAMSESAQQELIHATNELHLMYLHATDKVRKDDNLLQYFNIPKLLYHVSVSLGKIVATKPSQGVWIFV